MSDVIIAVIPAPGHEGLVAEGPMGERPALLVQTGDGHWIDGQHVGPFAGSDVVLRALVLYAPGGPRLGMVRAMEALGVIDCWCAPELGTDAEWRAFVRAHPDEDGVRQPNIPPPPRAAFGLEGPYAAAHLLHQRGLASEVLVLPVPA